MRGIKNIIILIITSFMAMGLVGCSEKILVVEDVKNKLEYDKKLTDMLQKSAEAFPNDSEKVFDEGMDEIRSDLESIFKKSKESSNLKLKDSIKKELKEIEMAYKDLLKNHAYIDYYMKFFDLQSISDEQKKAIKPLYEACKEKVERTAVEYIETVEVKQKTMSSVLNALTMVCEKDKVSYDLINKYYGLSTDKDYENIYNERIPEYKQQVDERYSLESSEIKYLDVKNQSEKEPIWEKAKAEIESKLKSSGKLTFPSNAMGQDVIMKKSGSIYIIKSYVDVEKGGSKERKEFTVKYDISMEYYMLISVTV